MLEHYLLLYVFSYRGSQTVFRLSASALRCLRFIFGSVLQLCCRWTCGWVGPGGQRGSSVSVRQLEIMNSRMKANRNITTNHLSPHLRLPRPAARMQPGFSELASMRRSASFSKVIYSSTHTYHSFILFASLLPPILILCAFEVFCACHALNAW